MAQPPTAPQGQWQSGLLACCSDCPTCCYGFWCLPCLFGGTTDRLRGGGCCSPCLAYYVLSLCYLCACTAKHTRHDVRRRFNLKEEPCGDCCVHCFCGPCAVCQEARELKRRGVTSYQPAAGQFVTTAVPPTQQYMV